MRRRSVDPERLPRQKQLYVSSKQVIPKTLVHQAILDPPC